MNHETYVFLERFGKPGGGKGILISDGFCPTLTGSMLYVMTEVEDEEDMHTDRHEECNKNQVCGGGGVITAASEKTEMQSIPSLH